MAKKKIYPERVKVGGRFKFKDEAWQKPSDFTDCIKVSATMCKKAQREAAMSVTIEIIRPHVTKVANV